MCGIAGTVGIENNQVVTHMIQAIQHRGPDGEGISYFPEVELALGHRRLAVIDLSARGQQPMSNGDQTIWITFNGEIYNHRELRRELPQGRYFSQSETDTEVILHLYQEFGTAAFEKLNGLFAFALYDQRKASLYLVRDQIGIKPLYYTEVSGKLLFGSEIKALLAAQQYRPQLDWQAACDFFSYLYVPGPKTIYQGIVQIPPAHWFEYHLLQRKFVRQHCYWTLADQLHTHKNALSKCAIVDVKSGLAQTTATTLRTTLGQAVKQQMISDVPLGVFLSGGLDSNLIVGLMAEHTSQPVKTFTVAFKGLKLDYYDECVEARRIAERFATDHYELPIDLSQPEEMFEVVKHFDQPFGNTTFYLVYLLSQLARHHVTVALSGAGGDELFGGYPRYRAVQAMRWLQYVPKLAARVGANVLAQWKDEFSSRRLQRLRSLLHGLDRDEAKQYLQWVYYFSEERKARLFARPLAQPGERLLRKRLQGYPAGWDDGNRFSFLDVETFLPDNLLEYSDKMSMAWGLELRVPFLDPALVKLAFQIPFHDKLNRGGSKQILRKVFAGLIPPENLRSPKKGFNLPLGHWMRTRLDRFFDEWMPRKAVADAGLFCYDAIQQLRAEHRAGKRDNSYELFAILSFARWHQTMIEGRS